MKAEAHDDRTKPVEAHISDDAEVRPALSSDAVKEEASKEGAEVCPALSCDVMKGNANNEAAAMAAKAEVEDEETLRANPDLSAMLDIHKLGNPPASLPPGASLSPPAASPMPPAASHMPPAASHMPPAQRSGSAGRSRDYRITVPRRDIGELFGDIPLKLPMEAMLRVSVMGEVVLGDQLVREG